MKFVIVEIFVPGALSGKCLQEPQFFLISLLAHLSIFPHIFPQFDMKKNRMTDGLMRGLQLAVEIEKGVAKGRERTRALSRPAPKWTKKEIKKLREEIFKMSQPEFASLLNVKPPTIRSWEQGQREPDGPAARLLEILTGDVEIAGKLAS